MNPGSSVHIWYTNHRGEARWRHVVPREIRFGSTEHHKEMQWLLEAFDVDKDASRTFAMNDIRTWMPYNETLAALLGTARDRTE